MTLSQGDRVGAYEILALFGAGGMGEVYRARDTRSASTGKRTLRTSEILCLS